MVVLAVYIFSTYIWTKKDFDSSLGKNSLYRMVNLKNLPQKRRNKTRINEKRSAHKHDGSDILRFSCRNGSDRISGGNQFGSDTL